MEPAADGVCLCEFGGRLLVLGGVDEDLEPANCCREFDPQSGRWQTKRPMHRARFFEADRATWTVSTDAHVYVFGGTTTLDDPPATPLGWALAVNREEVLQCERYSPHLDEWCELPPYTTRSPQRGASAEMRQVPFVLEGRVHVLVPYGCCRSGPCLACNAATYELFEWDDGAWHWHRRPTANFPCDMKISVCAVGDCAYVVGHTVFFPSKRRNDRAWGRVCVHRYDSRRRCWEVLPTGWRTRRPASTASSWAPSASPWRVGRGGAPGRRREPAEHGRGARATVAPPTG